MSPSQSALFTSTASATARPRPQRIRDPIGDPVHRGNIGSLRGHWIARLPTSQMTVRPSCTQLRHATRTHELTLWSRFTYIHNPNTLGLDVRQPGGGGWSAGPSPKLRNRRKTEEMPAMFLAMVSSERSCRAASFPDGSPIRLVPPPICGPPAQRQTEDRGGGRSLWHRDYHFSPKPKATTSSRGVRADSPHQLKTATRFYHPRDPHRPRWVYVARWTHKYPTPPRPAAFLVTAPPPVRCLRGGE